MPQDQAPREAVGPAPSAPWVVVAVGRPTFDLDEAQRRVDEALEVVSTTLPVRRAAPAILTDADEVAAVMAPSDAAGTIVLQATFADSRLVAAASAVGGPLVVWAFPEKRSGRALRLNSLCGLNLAAFRLRRDRRAFGWLYADPMSPDSRSRLDAAIAAARAGSSAAIESIEPIDHGGGSLPPWRVGLIGTPPPGFEACEVAGGEVAGARFERMPIVDLFAVAERQDALAVVLRWEDWADRVAGLDELDPTEVEHSVRLELALESVSGARGWDAAAVRCWPECFDRYGCAACAAMGSLTAAGTPTCCEADALGAATGILLSSTAGVPGFVADLVDIDEGDDTAALWHCGTAPATMADDRADIHAVEHPYRHRPLLREFALRPGPVTFARITQAGHRLRLVVGSGEILDRPRPYSGTSGVVRFSEPARRVLDTVINEGLEHHLGVVHGDVVSSLERFASVQDLPVVHLGR